MIINGKGARNQGDTPMPAPQNRQSPMQHGMHQSVGPVGLAQGDAHAKAAFSTPVNPSGPEQMSKVVTHSPLKLS